MPLNLLTPPLTANIPGFIRSCETYEGAFASSSQPYYDTGGNMIAYPRLRRGTWRVYGVRLGGRMLLKLVMSDEEREGRMCIQKENFVRWLAKMQGGEMDLAGYE